MNNLLQKTMSKKGFTLMEMLIVVAIIAVLVAIAIPVVTTQLTKAQQAADQANIRSANAVAAVTYLNDTGKAVADMYYQVDGTLLQSKANAYILKAAPPTYNIYGTYTEGQCIKVNVTAEGIVSITFDAAK